MMSTMLLLTGFSLVGISVAAFVIMLLVFWVMEMQESWRRKWMANFFTELFVGLMIIGMSMAGLGKVITLPLY